MRCAALVLLLASAATLADATPWPTRYLWESGRNFELVVLYEDGRAAYSERTNRAGAATAYFVASSARWHACKPEHDSKVAECIIVEVSGYNGREEVGFNVSYIRRDDALRPWDEGGLGHTLKRLSGS